MATKSQDVQLNIRAVDYSKRTTDQVVDSLKALNKAQDEQIDSAKKGAAAGADLEKSYNGITNAIKALSDQDKLIKSYDAQNERLATAKARLEAAKQAQEQFTASLTPGADITDKQAAKLERLGRAVAGAQTKFENAQAAVAGTGQRLEALGIESGQAAAAQEKITTAIGESVAVLGRLRNAYQGLGAAQASRNAELAEEAQKEKQVAVDIAFANAQRDAEIAKDKELVAAQKAVEAERERELGIDRQFTAAQAEMVAGIEREEQARRAQAAAISAAAAAANAAKGTAAATGRPGAVTATSDVAGQIRDIADPAAAAARNVTTLDASISKLEKTVSEISGPIQNYRDMLNQAKTAQAGLQQIAGNVDAYNRQIIALRAARAEYTSQRTALNQLVAAMQAGTGGDNILSQIQRQQGNLQRAAEGLANVTVQARAARDALRTAGVDTADMAASEAQLADQANRTAGAMRQLNTAFEEHGEAAKKGAAGLGGWLSGGRTTLSFAQRIRGELLGLATAFVGVTAAIEEGKASLEIYSERQSLLSTLTVAFAGDMKQAQQEFEYLRAQADRLSFAFDKIGPAYSKFAIAGKQAGLTGQEVRYTFEQLALAAQKGGLSTDKFESVLVAFEQMLSKGKVQSQELVQQLGNALPGAFEFAAKAISGTTAEFYKLLEAGGVSGTRVVEIAAAIGEGYGKAAGATNDLLQSQITLKNAIGDFQDTVAKSGFAKEFTSFLQQLSSFIQSDDGKKFAQNLGQAFSVVVDVLKLVAENIDLIKLGIETMIGLKFIGWALEAAKAIRLLGVAQAFFNTQIYATMGSSIVTFLASIGVGATAAAGGVGILEAAMAALTLGVELLTAAFPYLLIAVAAFAGIKFVWDKFFSVDDAKKAGEAAGKAGALAAQGAAATVPPPKRDTSFELLEKNQADVQTMIEKAEASLLEARKAGAKKNLDARKAFVDQEFNVQRDAAKKQYTDKAALEVALQQIQYASNIAQQAEQVRFNNETATTDESAAKKRKRLVEEIAQDFKAAQDDIAKRAGEADPTKSFAERTAANQKAIEDSYNKTISKIRELSSVDPGGAKRDTDQLNILIEQRKEIQKRVDAAAEVVRIDKQISNEMEIQKAQIDAIKARAATGEITPEQEVAQINAAVSATAPKIQALGQEVMRFATSVKDLLTPTELATALSKGTVAIARNNEEAIQSANNLNAAQAALNTILAERQRLLDTIKGQEQARLITSEEAGAQQDKVYGDFKQKVLDAVTAVKQLVEVTRDLKGAPADALDKISASMTDLTVKTENQTAVTTKLGDTIENSIVNQGMTAFDSLSGAVGKVLTGQESMADGFREAGKAAAAFAAGVLADLAKMIAKQMILNAVKSYFGASSAIGAAATTAGGMHTGGTVGSHRTFTRSVDPSVFTGAPRFHSGGFPGLMADEVPTILQKGEQVLARDDPSNVLNAKGGKGKGGAAGPSSVKFVLVDDRSNVPTAMQSKSGEQVIMQALRANIPTLRQWIK